MDSGRIGVTDFHALRRRCQREEQMDFAILRGAKRDRPCRLSRANFLADMAVAHRAHDADNGKRRTGEHQRTHRRRRSGSHACATHQRGGGGADRGTDADHRHGRACRHQRRAAQAGTDLEVGAAVALDGVPATGDQLLARRRRRQSHAEGVDHCHRGDVDWLAGGIAEMEDEFIPFGIARPGSGTVAHDHPIQRSAQARITGLRQDPAGDRHAVGLLHHPGATAAAGRHATGKQSNQ